MKYQGSTPEQIPYSDEPIRGPVDLLLINVTMAIQTGLYVGTIATQITAILLAVSSVMNTIHILYLNGMLYIRF